MKSGVCALLSVPALLALSDVSGCGRKSVVSRGSPALYWKRLKNGVVQCNLCPNDCVITEGEMGFCRVRGNFRGELNTYAYGNPCSVNLDPIEKKPFFHVLPSTSAFSIATAGCNFRCKNCQNWEISQVGAEETENYALSPDDVVASALRYGAKSVAYTYSEPAIFFEYMIDCAKKARQKGLLNVLHTNGFIRKEPLEELCGNVDAINVDLKSISATFYDEVCSGELKPVQETLKTIKEKNVHLEITSLLIPGLSDNEEEIAKLSRWVASELGKEIPLHFSRFYPVYKLSNLPPTPSERVEGARNVAMSLGMKFVYTGNLPEHRGEGTVCLGCGRTIIARSGYQVLKNDLVDGKCKFCGKTIPGIWKTG